MKWASRDADIFGSCPEAGRRFLPYTAYGKHLDYPVEPTAEILVSLGVFPAKIA
jgi:hypothetical protein